MGLGQPTYMYIVCIIKFASFNFVTGKHEYVCNKLI